MAHQSDVTQPEQFIFKDGGAFPNSRLPLLLYRRALATDSKDPASIFEERFAANNWTNSWRDGVYSFPHYHSTSHEVLGVYRGSAKLRLGGEHGKTFDVSASDVIVIPPAWCIKISMPVRISVWSELTLADANGICSVVWQPNGQRPTATSPLCPCRTTIRFMAARVR
jgi:hypothetical protein